MNTLHYNISGIMKTETKTQVKNSLDKIKGVHKVNLNLTEGTIDIDYNEPADVGQIRSSIESTGFTIE